MTTTTITIENFTHEELRIDIPNANPPCDVSHPQFVGAATNKNNPGRNAVAFSRPNSGLLLTIFKKGTILELGSMDVKETQLLKCTMDKNNNFQIG